MADEKWEFIIEQYKWLRQEQLNKKDKQYQITSLGIGGIVALLGIAFQFDVYSLFLLIPIVIIISIVMFDAECHAIINISDYGYNLEEAIISNIDDGKLKALGWERWLRENRLNDNVTNKAEPYYIFDLASKLALFTLYFGCVLYIIVGFTKNSTQLIWVFALVICAFYFLLGLCLFYYYIISKSNVWYNRHNPREAKPSKPRAMSSGRSGDH